jgi:hypothetical protein
LEKGQAFSRWIAGDFDCAEENAPGCKTGVHWAVKGKWFGWFFEAGFLTIRVVLA